MEKLILFVALGLLSSFAVFADIAKPENPKTEKAKASYETTLDIRLKADAKDATLIIPKSQFKQLRAQLDALDNGSENTAAVVSGSGFSATQTIMSGLFLSLAIVFGGVWFMRAGKATPNKGVIAAVLLSCVASATFVFANAGPPAEARSITGKMFSPAMHMYGFGWGKIKVETTDDDNDRITLIVPNPKSENGKIVLQ
jgi:hypothetical protein